MTFDELAVGPRGNDRPRSPDWLPGNTQDILRGYGAEAYELTEEDLNRLRRGDIMMLDANGEYGVYIRARTGAVTPAKSPGVFVVGSPTATQYGLSSQSPDPWQLPDGDPPAETPRDGQ